MMHIIGIDVGMKGGVCALTLDESFKVTHANLIPMPSDKANKTIYLEDLIIWCVENTFGTAPYPTYVYYEVATAFSKQGVVSMFNFGRQFGLIEGLVKSLKIISGSYNVEFEYTMVHTKAWQKQIIPDVVKGLENKEKKLFHLKRALELYPSLESKFYGKKGGYRDGTVDALLISEFGRRHRRGDFPFKAEKKASKYLSKTQKDERMPANVLDIIQHETKRSLRLLNVVNNKTYKRKKEQDKYWYQKMRLMKLIKSLDEMEAYWKRKRQVGMPKELTSW